MRAEDADGGCDTTDPAFWCPRYKNCGTVDEFLGDSQPAWVEVVAVRVAQWLNSCVSLDWCYQNCFVRFVREVGPGLRVAQFLTAVYVVFFAPVVLKKTLLFEHDVFYPNPEMKFGDVTLSVTFYFWAIDFALLALSWYLIRHHGTPPRCGEAGELTIFYRIPTRLLREDREKQPLTCYQHFVRGFFAALFGSFFVLGVFSMHTILSHMYVRRNPYFAWMLVVQTVVVFLAAVDDLTQIGSPWGIQECSKIASILLSFRALFLIPVTIIWSIAAIAASFPLSYCVEC